MFESRGRLSRFFSKLGVLLLVGAAIPGCRSLPLQLTVCELQGTGLESPYQGREVIVHGLVSADLEGFSTEGFTLLDVEDPLVGECSRGVFVNLGEGNDLVDLGDEVRVRGVVCEKDGETWLESSSQKLEILSLSNPLPEPIDLGGAYLPPEGFSYECLEGQLVSIPRAELIESRSSPGRAGIIPQLELDPDLQLVCFQSDSFTLDLRGNPEGMDVFPVQAGCVLENLVGLIRQGQEGYYLQLVNEQESKILSQLSAGGDRIPAQMGVHDLGTPGILGMAARAPTTTPEVSQTASPVPSPTIIPSPTVYPIYLLITEILPNPVGEEPGGEWIEIFNPGSSGLLLDGIKIGDEISPPGKEGMLRFPDGHTIGGGQVMVIASQAGIFKSWYGFLPDFEMVDSDARVPDLLPCSHWGGNAVKLANSGDEVLLVDPWDQVVDLVVYGSSGAGGFSPPVDPPKEGRSLVRLPPERDRDQAGDWLEDDSPSPGKLNTYPPPTKADPTSTPSPTGTASSTVIFPTGTPETLSPSSTATLSAAPSETFLPTVSQTAELPSTSLPSPTWIETCTLPPPETLPVTRTPTASSTFEITGSPTPTLVGTRTLTPSPEPSPTVGMSPTSNLPAPSATIFPSATEAVTALPTMTSTPFNTETEEPTPVITPGPSAVINEIHADPHPLNGDANGDGLVSSDDDEFVEVVNLGGETLDLSGWQISDSIRVRFVFPAETYLSPGCGAVIFGGGDPSADFGGSLVFSTGSLGLNNAGDIVSLIDGDGVERAAVIYGMEGGQDQSLTRYPDLTGPVPLVPHGELPESSGALFSPGRRLDGTVFGNLP